MRAFLQFASLAIAVLFIAYAFIMKPTVPDPHSPAIFGVVGALSIIAIAIIEVANSLDNHE